MWSFKGKDDSSFQLCIRRQPLPANLPELGRMASKLFALRRNSIKLRRRYSSNGHRRHGNGGSPPSGPLGS